MVGETKRSTSLLALRHLINAPLAPERLYSVV